MMMMTKMKKKMKMKMKMNKKMMKKERDRDLLHYLFTIEKDKEKKRGGKQADR